MKTTYNCLPLALGIALLLSSCNGGDLEPSSEIEKISNSYQKIETGASKEEIDAVVKSGKEHMERYTSRYRSLRDVSGAGYDVGVVPTSVSCPLNSEMVVFFIDNENDGANTRTNGFKGAWEITGSKDSYLRFCKVDGRVFNNMQGTFAVLKLGPNNPTGFRAVSMLLMDNQDSGSTSIPSGASNVSPNYVDGDNLRLVFTNFKLADGATPTAFPNLGFSYGVMGWTQLSLENGQYYTDDEDHNNETTEALLEGTGAGQWIPYDLVRINNSSFEVAGTNFRLSKVK